MDNQTDDQTVFLSQTNQEEFTHIVTQQGLVGQGRLKRRRKRSRPENEMAGLRKRKLNAEQLSLLEMNFGDEHKLESERKYRLASVLGLDPRTVSVWFQNRRARWKSKKMEEEYCSLKKAHESVVVQNSQLESEIMKLKEQLSEAEMEIKRLSSNSPSSSLTMDVMDEAPFIGEFGCEDAFYMQETINIINGMEWVNLYNDTN